MNKRGEEGSEELFLHIAYITVIVSLSLILIFFITNAVKGDSSKSELTAKQMALFIDASEPGMEITLNHPKADIQLDESLKKISVKIKDVSYSYNYVSPYKISLDNDGYETKIKVENEI